MKNFLTLFFLSFIIISCQKKVKIENTKTEEEGVSISQITTNYDTLINRVKSKGNEDAYDELFYGLMDSNEAGRTDSIMVYSKIMATKFNFEQAYFDYFEAFCRKNKIDIDFSDYSKIDISKLNKNTKKEASDWLKKMVKEKMITTEQFGSIKK